MKYVDDKPKKKSFNDKWDDFSEKIILNIVEIFQFLIGCVGLFFFLCVARAVIGVTEDTVRSQLNKGYTNFKLDLKYHGIDYANERLERNGYSEKEITGFYERLKKEVVH